MMLEEANNQESFDRLTGHVTQSWEWGEFRTLTPTIKKVLRLLSGDRTFQIIFSKVPHLPFTIAYLPRSPMPTTEELEEIKDYCRKEKAIFLKIEPGLSLRGAENDEAIGNGLPRSARNDVGVKSDPVLPQHTIYIDLTKSEEELLKEMHEKTRYNIRLAEKKGVVVKEENSEEGLEKFITILEATEKRQGFYSHSADYYRLLWKSLSPHNMVHILNAYLSATSNQQPASQRGEPAASIMLFHFKDFLYYPYGGSNPEYREFMAPQLLHWEAIKLGKRLGAKTYDLWGSYKYSKSESDPFYGIYRLKSGFGGKDVDFPDSIDVPISPLYPFFRLANTLRWAILKLIRSTK